MGWHVNAHQFDIWPFVGINIFMGLSVRELKAELAARGVDFSHCCEKCELQQLLVSSSPPSSSLPEEFFAVHRDGRRCWVEFVDGPDALCHWSDGDDSIVPAAELEPLELGFLSEKSFEEARTEAFRAGRVLVAAVVSDDSLKKNRLQVLASSSEEVEPLLQENAVFWRGRGDSLRAPHLQQLAPNGLPSLAMVLPIAADAMRVISCSGGTRSEEIVDHFVQALEAQERHRETSAVFSETTQLRQEQDEEFLTSLEADRLAELEKAHRVPDTAVTTEDKDSESAPQVSSDVEDKVKMEGLAKRRRVLADEFLSEPEPVGPKTRLALKLPGGERLERTFGAQEPLSRACRWAECCAFLPEARGRELHIPEHFELTTAFPPRHLHEEEGQSLADLGLTPSAALLLIDKTA